MCLILPHPYSINSPVVDISVRRPLRNKNCISLIFVVFITQDMAETKSASFGVAHVTKASPGIHYMTHKNLF